MTASTTGITSSLLFLKMADERDIAIPKDCDGGNRSFDGKLEPLLKDLNKAIAA